MEKDKGQKTEIVVCPRGISRLWKKPWTISFWKGSHTYRIDGEPTISVTRVTGQTIDKSDWLGPWNGKMAIEHLQSFKKKDLIRAIKKNPEKLYADAKGAADRARDEASSFGKDVHTFIHKCIEHGMIGQSHKPGVRKTAETFFEKIKQFDIEVIVSEYIVGSLQHMFTGTLDLLVRMAGKLILIDIKTGKSIGPEAFLQTAGGYTKAWEEMTGQKIDEAWVCHVRRPPMHRVDRYVMPRVEILRAQNQFVRAVRSVRWVRRTRNKISEWRAA